jgi:predicted RNA-binding Zn-ribbon protein involved in translation (DUF1610 family)
MNGTMTDYQHELEQLRYWNRASIIGFIAILPITGITAVLTTGTFLFPVLPFAAFVSCAAFFIAGYIKIRTFHCPQCGNLFTVKHAFAANSRGRKCVHCGLEAYIAAAEKTTEAGRP